MRLARMAFLTLVCCVGGCASPRGSATQPETILGDGALIPENVALAKILPLSERAALRDAWLSERLTNLLPALMRRTQIDCWILVARENNEDPVLATMLPAEWLAARRRTILMFTDEGAGPVEALAVARYDVGDVIPGAWDPETQPDQWARLAELVAERAPRRIGLNVSPTFAKADGLSASERDALLRALGEHAERVVSAESLAVGWLEARLPGELEVYRDIVSVAHAILAEGLSARAIDPGHTSTVDLEWWFRERVAELRLDTWFHPTVSVQRAGGEERDDTFASDQGAARIERGDLVHVDFGISYLGLNTDTQQHAYVLRSGESAAPAELQRALTVGNRVQDLLTREFVTGRSGNEILAAALSACADEHLDALIYTHPLGYHGHGAGPTIGLWDQQGGVPGRGDYRLFSDTVHSIELGVAVDVPSWGEKVRIMLEEDAVFDGERVRYLHGRQRALHLVR